VTTPPRHQRPGFRARLKWLWKRLRGGELTPSRLGKSVALGLFIGVQPIYGLHLPLCAALAVPLRLDLIATYAAANVSIAPLAPFLLALEVEVGALLLSGRHAAFSVEQARELGITGFVAQAVVGALLLGSILGFLGGLGTWIAARRFRGTTPLSTAIERTVARYSAAGPADRSYVAAKLASDPVVELLAAQPPLGRVVDAGAGRGQLGLLLLELGRTTELTAFDWDERKVGAARLAAGGDARIEQASVTTWDWQAADTVLLVDVLHYLAVDEQDEVLRQAALSLAPNGRLLIREVDASRGWASRLTILAERLGTRFGYNRGARLCFRPAADLEAVLTGCGLECELRSAATGTPLANVLIVARRTREHPDP
jgi:uncharacterized protein (DUF2062 family)/2-polyprenyl-3-methyl-5-hydroxy-6-metoxy-1,4-benzoquinol methylase